MKENSNAQSWKKRKLKFDEYYERYEIMKDMSTNRCPYIYEQDRSTTYCLFVSLFHSKTLIFFVHTERIDGLADFF